MIKNPLSFIEDQHEPGGYCIVKFNIPKNYDVPCAVVLNQIHARFVDETMRGSYKYAPLRLMLAKFIKTESKDGKPAVDELAFIEGDYMSYQHSNLELSQLTEGDYVIFFKAEWHAMNPVRKLVLNLYAPEVITMQRLKASTFPPSVF